MPISVNPEIRNAYLEVRNRLMQEYNMSLKAAMLESKRLIMENEIRERDNRPVQAEGGLREFFERAGNFLADNVALTALENQLNQLVVNDVNLL